MDTKLKEMHEQACLCGEHIMHEKNEISGAFFLLLINGEVKRFDTPWDDEQEKYMYIGVMRVILRERMIDAYSFVTEAWMAKINPRTQQDLMNIPPRERSDREDILMILSRNRDGESYATRYHVDYTAEGTVILGPADHLKGDFHKGLIGNMFEDPT
jgi:hypothetical protein